MTSGWSLAQTNVPSSHFRGLTSEQRKGTEHHKIKAEIQKKYNRRVKLVQVLTQCKKQDNPINTHAVPVVTYSYGVIDWKLGEIRGLDKMTRKHLCINKMYAKKADTDRISVPYQES